MIPLFHIHGYRAPDPLDHISETTRRIIATGVTAVLSAGMVYAIDPMFHLVQFISIWMMLFEIVGFALFVGFVLVDMRKASSIVHYLIILVPLYLVDLYLQSHVREEGRMALWMYYPGTFIDAVKFLPLRFLMTISVDALLVGPIALWVSRLVAVAVLKPDEKKEMELERRNLSAPSPSDPAWSDEPVAKPRRGPQYWVLRLLGIAYLAYMLFLGVGALGSSPWPEQIRDLFDTAFANPFTGVSTFSKIGFMVLLAFTAAYNERIRWYATLGLCIGHLMSVVISLLFYFIGASPPAQHRFLLVSAIVDLVMVLLFVWILITSHKQRDPFTEDETFPSTFSLPDRLSRTGFRAVGILALAMIAAILLVRFLCDRTTPLGALFGSPEPTLGNAITMYTVIALLSFLMVKRSRLRDYLMQVLLFGFLLTMIPSVLWLLFADVIVRQPSPMPVHALFVGNLVLTTTLYVALIGLRKMSYDVDYSITSFNPSSARNVIAMHNALFPDAPERSSDVLQSIDRFAGAIRGRKRGLLNFPFWLVENLFNVIFALRPSFSTMSVAEQRYFLRNYLLRRPEERRKAMMPELAGFARDMSVGAHAIILFATYSQLKRHKLIGYVPPGARDRLQSDFPTLAPPFRNIAPLPIDQNDPNNWKPAPPSPPTPPAVLPRLTAPRVSTPVDEPPAPKEVDFVVIGSGPGGAVMAYRLAQECPDASILIIERGARYSPLQDFNDHEIEMMPKLYKEGGLQQTKRADMFVLQGECVGGGGVINNAICYQMPQSVASRWATEYGIPLGGIGAEYTRIAGELHITPLPVTSVNTDMESHFVTGVNGYNAHNPGTPLTIRNPSLANAEGAIGDGLWNIGNRYLRKRSVLETYIPWAEARGMANAPKDEPRIRVISNTTAVQFFKEGTRAKAIQLRNNTGGLQTIGVRRGIVVAGGVISSSHFLMRSGITKNVGCRMSCNFAFPLVFAVDREVRAFDGEQITVGATTPGKGMIFETYFNPPSAFALSVPFYFNRLESIMRSYPHLLNFGVLVGSEPRGVIEQKSDLINGQPFTWSLGDHDRDNIRFALSTLLEIGAHAGAKRAVVPMQPGVELDLQAGSTDRAEFVRRLNNYRLSMGDMLLSTAHPQGGNMMAASSSSAFGNAVVDETFRVKGLDNVFVADASLFPTGVDINPQWTIMAMSSLASREVMKLC